MKNIDNIGALGIMLAQDICYEKNVGTCEAGLTICEKCPEKSKGNKRKFNNDFQKRMAAKEKKIECFIISSFIFNCSLVFSFGLLLGIFIQKISAKMAFAFIFFCVASYLSRNKLDGRIAYGGMEKPFTFSFGISMFFLANLFMSQGMQYFGFAILCHIPGIYFLYQGYKEGPFNGWRNYLRNRNAI